MVDLSNEEAFRDGTFWSTLGWLQENEPVAFLKDHHGREFVALTRYSDVVKAYGRPDIFISGQGMQLNAHPAAVAAVSQRMLIVSDAPAHTRLKRVLSRAFTGAEVGRLESLVRRVTNDLLDDMTSRGPFNFLDVARALPTNVVCAVLGVPRADWTELGRLTTDAFEGQPQERSAANAEIFSFFEELVEARRRTPSDDLVTALISSADDGDRGCSVSDDELVYNLNGILSGANETTRFATAGAVAAFGSEHRQWMHLRDTTQSLRTAVEEVLRWTVPGMHAMRTTTRDVHIDGCQITRGMRVTLWNGAANRDPRVFAKPFSFDVTRDPNRHVTFGSGRHVCLGARLARLELGVFLDVLREKCQHIRLLQAPRYNGSNFTWGVDELWAEFS